MFDLVTCVAHFFPFASAKASTVDIEIDVAGSSDAMIIFSFLLRQKPFGRKFLKTVFITCAVSRERHEKAPKIKVQKYYRSLNFRFNHLISIMFNQTRFILLFLLLARSHYFNCTVLALAPPSPSINKRTIYKLNIIKSIPAQSLRFLFASPHHKNSSTA
jgi:hypothetical protein